MLRLSSLYRFPLKSCKAETLQRASFDPMGLAGDRRWMLVDESTGRFFTQRAIAHMSQLSVLWNASGGVTLSAPGFDSLDVAVPLDVEATLRGVTVWRDSLQVPDAGEVAAEWVSRFIGKPTRMVYMPAERALDAWRPWSRRGSGKFRRWFSAVADRAGLARRPVRAHGQADGDAALQAQSGD